MDNDHGRAASAPPAGTAVGAFYTGTRGRAIATSTTTGLYSAYTSASRAAGRTTLLGEGLQHQDGHSHVLASTVPACQAYDPAFAYETAVIVADGKRIPVSGDGQLLRSVVPGDIATIQMPSIPGGDKLADGRANAAVEMLAAALPALLAQGAQAVLLGSGEARYEQSLAALAAAHPGAVTLQEEEGQDHNFILGNCSAKIHAAMASD